VLAADEDISSEQLQVRLLTGIQRHKQPEGRRVAETTPPLRM